MRRLGYVFLLSGILTASGRGQNPRPSNAAQTIYYDGNILTGVGLGTAHPERVSALAINNGVILATGSDRQVLDTWKQPQTRLVDLRGAFVLPGINDAHVHLADAGQQKLSLDLTGVASLDRMLALIHQAAEAAPAGRWLTGGGWDQTLWRVQTLPTRYDLDRVTGDHPAIFERVDGHIAIANTAALRAGGVTRETPDPQGGKIDRDPSGALTGILRDTVMDEVLGRIPPPTMREREQALTIALNDAACNGLTSVQDYSPGWQNFLVLASMEKQGKLPIRVYEWPDFNDPVETLEQERGSQPASDRRLRVGMLKGFMDGSLGSRTAAMIAPYADDPANSGIARYTQARLNEMTIERARQGFQIGFHAIGDRANGMALDAFAAAERAVPHARDQRFRIEHAQVVSPGDFERFHELNVIASMQPSQLLTDMRWARARLGASRVPYSYAWKSFLDHDVVLAFGTDYPVEPITPFRGIYAAVTRENEAGTASYDPGQRLTLNQALYAYTQGSAYAEFSERWKGKLAPGYVADFDVLDRDLTKDSTARHSWRARPANYRSRGAGRLPRGRTRSESAMTPTVDSQSTAPKISRNAKAHLLMFSIVGFWGASFVVVKEALGHMGPQWFNAWRMTVAFGCLAIVYRGQFRRLTPTAWAAGAIAGACMSAGFFFQAQGLLYTTATNSAFLTALVVVLVPFLASIPGLRSPGGALPQWSAWMGALLAFLGVALLTTTAHTPWLQIVGTLNRGDILSIGCAVGFAAQIIALDHGVRRVRFDQLTLLQVGFCMVFLTVGACWTEPPRPGVWKYALSAGSPLHSPWFLFELGMAGIVATAVGFSIQTWAQQVIPATNIAVITTLEPVFAYLTAFVVLHEDLNVRRGLGALLVLAGIIAVEFVPRWQQRLLRTG